MSNFYNCSIPIPESEEASASYLVRAQKPHFKILFAGDSGCGKTRLIQTYLRKDDPHTTIHTPMFTTYVYYLGAKISLVDLGGSCDIADAFECFDSTFHVAIFFFSVDNLQSLETLRDCWIPAFRHFCGFEVPTILVGNKRDLRAPEGLETIASPQPNRVSFIHGMKVKNSCGMNMFLECSAEDQESINCVFQAAYSYIM